MCLSTEEIIHCEANFIQKPFQNAFISSVELKFVIPSYVVSSPLNALIKGIRYSIIRIQNDKLVNSLPEKIYSKREHTGIRVWFFFVRRNTTGSTIQITTIRFDPEGLNLQLPGDRLND